MNNLHILVTGGAGFIGSHLVDELLSQGHTVNVIDNLSNGSLNNIEHQLSNPKFQFLKGNILDKKDCLEAMTNVDVVFHLACLGVRHSLHSPFENHRVNAEGTLNILECGLQKKVKKFFYISTSEIYGGVQNFPIRESDLPAPLTVYGASKLVGEHYTNAFHMQHSLDTTVLRIFNNYGPRAHYEGDAGEIIPRTIVKILYNERPIIFGDGSITRDFIFVKDTAKALSGLLGLPGLSGKTFNIGSGVELTMKNLVESILRLIPQKGLEIDYQDPRPVDVPRLWVDPEKFFKVTSFRPQTHFLDGLQETISYYQSLVTRQNLIQQIQNKNWQKQS